MADIGSIDFRQEQPQPTGTAENRGIVEDLAALGGAFIKEHDQDVLAEFETAEEAISQEAVTKDGTDTDAPDKVLGEVERFRQTLLKRKAAIEQGNVSQRADAELKLRTELSNFKSRYGTVADKLEQEFGTFLRTDPNLAKLGIEDAEHKGFSSQAARAMRDVTDRAFAPVSRGGFGMNSTLDPYGTEFARQYVDHAKTRAGFEANAETMLVQQQTKELSAEALEASIQTTLTGKSTVIYAGIEDAIDDQNEISLLFTKGLTGATSARINEWQNVERPRHVKNAQRKMIELEQWWTENADFTQSDTAAFKRSERLKNGALDHLEKFIVAMESENPTLIQQWETERELRTTEWRDRSPDLDESLDVVEAIGPIIKFAEVVGPGDLFPKSGIGEIAIRGLQAIPKLLKEVYKDGPQGAQGTGPPAAPGAKLVRTARQLDEETTYNRSINENEMGLPSGTPLKEKKIKSIEYAKQLNGMLSAILPESAPRFTVPAVDAMASHYKRIATMPGKIHDEQMEGMFAMVNGPNLNILLDQAPQGPQLTETTRFLGNKFLDAWIKYKGGSVGRQQELDEDLATVTQTGRARYRGITLGSVLQIDIADIEKGRISVVVDPVKLDAAFTAALVQPQDKNKLQTKVNKASETQISREFQRAAGLIEQKINLYMRTNAHIGQLRTVGVVTRSGKDYVNAFGDSSFDLLLDTPGWEELLGEE